MPHSTMLGENLTRRPEDPSLQLTPSQVDILRLLGKGNSFKVKDVPQRFEADAEEEMGKMPALVILDEIQNIQGWERWVRKAIDLGRYQVIVTGSSSHLLSSEIATPCFAGLAMTD